MSDTKYKFKEGDKVEVRENCSGCVAGGIYTLIFSSHLPTSIGRILVAKDSNMASNEGCTCTENWILVEESCTSEFGFAEFRL